MFEWITVCSKHRTTPNCLQDKVQTLLSGFQIFSYYSLLLQPYSLLLNITKVVFPLCTTPCLSITLCVLLFLFLACQNLFSLTVLCARHCSNLWCYRNEQHRRQSLFSWSCHSGWGERGHSKQMSGGNECNEE